MTAVAAEGYHHGYSGGVIGRTVVLALAIGCLGCSRIITKGVPRGAGPEVTCSTSKTGPIVDEAIAVVYGAVGLIGAIVFLAHAGDIGEQDEGNDTAPAWFFGAVFAGSGAVIAIPFGLSARGGRARVRACWAHNARWRQERELRAPSPVDPYPR